MNKFSPHMLKTFKTCPQKYYYKYIKELSVPQRSSIFERGKRIHALANYYLKGNDITKFVEILDDDEKLMWNRLLNNEYFQKTYVNSEYDLMCNINGFWIGGRLDAVVKDNFNIYILDYKTGKIPNNPEYDYQTMVYLLCIKNRLKLSKINFKIHFVYIDLKNNKNCIITLDNDKQEKYECEITEICKIISKFKKADNFIKTNECNLCEYNKFCQ